VGRGERDRRRESEYESERGRRRGAIRFVHDFVVEFGPGERSAERVARARGECAHVVVGARSDRGFSRSRGHAHPRHARRVADSRERDHTARAPMRGSAPGGLRAAGHSLVRDLAASTTYARGSRACHGLVAANKRPAASGSVASPGVRPAVTPRGHASCVERATGFEPATFSLGSCAGVMPGAGGRLASRSSPRRSSFRAGFRKVG